MIIQLFLGFYRILAHFVMKTSFGAGRHAYVYVNGSRHERCPSDQGWKWRAREPGRQVFLRLSASARAGRETHRE